MSIDAHSEQTNASCRIGGDPFTTVTFHVQPEEESSSWTEGNAEIQFTTRYGSVTFDFGYLLDANESVTRQAEDLIALEEKMAQVAELRQTVNTFCDRFIKMASDHRSTLL